MSGVMKTKRIRALKVDEISLCRTPANRHAVIALAKSAEAANEGGQRLVKSMAARARELRAAATGAWSACSDCPDPRLCGARHRCGMETPQRKVAKADASPAERLLIAAEERAAELVRRRG